MLARVVRSLQPFNSSMSTLERRQLIQSDPDADELEMARTLQIFFSQSESARALREGRLTSLGGRVKKGIVVVSGRIPEQDMGSILGKPYLPVVWPNTKLVVAPHILDHQEYRVHIISSCGS